MLLTTYNEAAAFLDKTQVFLEQQEVVNSLLLGVVVRLRDAPEIIEAPPYLATVDDGERLVVAAVMTPPHKLIVASDQADYHHALGHVVRDLLTTQRQVPGVNGVAPLSAVFGELWQAATHQVVTMERALRTFMLTKVIRPHYPAGRLRVATMADRELLIDWVAAFGQEALGESVSELPRTAIVVNRAINAGNYFVWDDHGVVAMAGRTRPTRAGITIGPVYTPPEFRKRGYATALVAELSQLLLDEGREFVTLFTDLANPTSNKIYQQIGFRPVCDFAEYRFQAL